MRDAFVWLSTYVSYHTSSYFGWLVDCADLTWEMQKVATSQARGKRDSFAFLCSLAEVMLAAVRRQCVYSVFCTSCILILVADWIKKNFTTPSAGSPAFLCRDSLLLLGVITLYPRYLSGAIPEH